MAYEVVKMAYYRKRNGKWNAQIRRAGLKTVSKTFTLKVDAIKWATTTEAQLETESYIDYKLSTKTRLSELLNRYNKEVVPSLKGKMQDSSRIRIINKGLGSLFLSELTPLLLAEYRDTRLKQLSAQSVKHELSMISRVLKIATNEWGYVLSNGIPTVKHPTLPKGRTRRLSKEEETALLKVTDSYLTSVIKLLQATAMRIGELAKLRIDDIDFNKSLAVLNDTKNGDTRTIPLSNIAITALKELIKESKTDKVLCLTSSYISHKFNRACKQANIEGMVLHSLRHEAVSRLFEKGFSIMEVSSISGHKDLSMLKRYTHINPETLVSRL